MSDSIELSGEQTAALARIREWRHREEHKQTFFLEGAAGTGKTTLIRHIGELLGGVAVVYGAFTGKAASVMRSKGCEDADTIHSLIYCPTVKYSCVKRPPCNSPPCSTAVVEGRCPYVREEATDYALNPASAVADADLVVIDEISQVNAELGRDLLSFETKVLVVGDHNQLPPVEGGGYFTNARPDFSLTEIHRQEAGSPVIHLATQSRLGAPMLLKAYGDSAVIAQHQFLSERLINFNQVICGRHKTRCAHNRHIREILGFAGDVPLPLNGTTWKVIEAAADGRGFYDMVIESGDNGRIVHAVSPIATFGLENGDGGKYPRDPFDWGYAMTCHKAQGSQWESVCLIDESYCWRRDNQHRNWLYTGVTRAAKRIVIVM
jgi:exodeoxyribonuclease-5